MQKRYYNESKTKKPDSVESLKVEAEKGNAEAQFKLGVCYLDGEGVKKDYAEAVKWLRKVAEQGYAEAKEILQQIENEKNR
ncbi:MAG: hypothetical protein LBT09_14095 [Planctomycetaceae bacterium]|nr:hypothetical protein [Planctomycetaceae bacterium]